LRLTVSGMGAEEIGRVLGRTCEAVRSRRKQIRLTDAERAERKEKARVRDIENRASCEAFGPPRFIHRPTPAMVAERDERFGQPRTFEQTYLGDPLPGQSALDKRNRELSHGAS